MCGCACWEPHMFSDLLVYQIISFKNQLCWYAWPRYFSVHYVVEYYLQYTHIRNKVDHQIKLVLRNWKGFVHSLLKITPLALHTELQTSKFKFMPLRIMTDREFPTGDAHTKYLRVLSIEGRNPHEQLEQDDANRPPISSHGCIL